MLSICQILIISIVGFHMLMLFLVIMFFMMTGRGEILSVGKFLSSTDPDFFKLMGVALCVGMSVMASATGIFTVGSTILGTGVKKPHVKTKNLISVIFCEAEAIYGLIMAIVMIGYIQPATNKEDHYKHDREAMTGYIIFGCGLSVGCVNFAGATATGVIGSGTCLADGANPLTFVKNLLLEIFAGAISLFGVVLGIYLCSKAKI